MRNAVANFFVAIATLLPVGSVAVGGTACSSGPDSHTLEDGIAVASVGTAAANGGVSPAPNSSCAAPTEGCPCDVDGATMQCAGPKIRTGNYITCALGTRACERGAWGRCLSKTVYQGAYTLTEDYASPCPTGTRVRWGAITLDGHTPEDSYVDIRVQTADNTAGLDGSPSVPVARFDGPTHPEWTSVDVDSVLTEGGYSSSTWLRVTVVSAPSSQSASAPVVADWRLATTCAAAL